MTITTAKDRLLRAQALVSRARRDAKVATSRQGLVSNAELLFSLAEAIEKGETEFWARR